MASVDSELREILEVLLQLPPDRISQVRELLLSLRDESDAPAEFQADAAAFERMRADLRRQYPGRVVAIYKGDVVADGEDKMAVFDAVLQRYGPVVCFIDSVESTGPRHVRIPSSWITR